MMKKIYTLAIVLLVLGVSSCKLGKHYSRPELRLPEQIEGTVPDSVSAGDIRWTDLYTDPVLRQLIRKTLEGNKDLMIAAAKVKESMELRRIAKADLFPKAEATVSAEREYDETPGNTFEGKVLASWEVDLWGKLRWAGQAALAEYLQSVEGRQALQSALVAQVAQAYFELIALNPLRQAQVELARTQTLVPGLEREIRLKENQITLLAGEYPGEVARGKSIGQQQLMTALPVGLSSRILERRPDIRQAEYRLKAAHAKVGVAYTSMFPKFTLTGHYGLESSDLTDFLKAPYFFVGGELLAPVFNLGKNRARLKASRAVQEQETYNYQKVVLQAFTEVSNALVNSRKSREIRESREHLEQSARSNLDLATLQYINGVISYLDVLDAQRGYFDRPQYGYPRRITGYGTIVSGIGRRLFIGMSKNVHRECPLIRISGIRSPGDSPFFSFAGIR